MTDQNVAYILLPKIKAYAKSFSDRTNEKAIAIEEHVPVSGCGSSLLDVVRSESSWLSFA